MLLNPVTAARSNTAGGFLPPPWESAALMACCTAMAPLAGAILFAPPDA